ncbi:MAG: hypothetical protein IH876_12270, partial [Gemmatimonadetes bacterium]|nr:hypothetical protein [Gemmatimonadota bacterium]
MGQPWAGPGKPPEEQAKMVLEMPVAPPRERRVLGPAEPGAGARPRTDPVPREALQQRERL